MKVTRPIPAAEETGERQTAEGLEELFARYQDELLGTLFYLLSNLEDARDALQDTFVKCWRHRDKLAEVENRKAWIFRVAWNTALDFRRSAWRRRRSPMKEEQVMLVSENPGPQADAEHNEQLSRLRQAVGNLRAEEQEVFLLRQNGQLTYNDIAEAVGIPLNTVKTRMRLALSRMRIALASD